MGTLNAVAWTYFFSETLAVHTQWVSEDAYFARGVLLGGWSLLLTILFSLALSALTRAKVRLVTECKAGGMTDAEVEHEAEGVNESAEVLLLLGSKKRHDSTSISHRTRPRPIQDHVHAREEKKKAQGSYVGRAAKGIQGIATFQKSSWKPFYLAVIGLVDSSSGWCRRRLHRFHLHCLDRRHHHLTRHLRHPRLVGCVWTDAIFYMVGSWGDETISGAVMVAAMLTVVSVVWLVASHTKPSQIGDEAKCKPKMVERYFVAGAAAFIVGWGWVLVVDAIIRSISAAFGSSWEVGRAPFLRLHS